MTHKPECLFAPTEDQDLGEMIQRSRRMVATDLREDPLCFSTDFRDGRQIPCFPRAVSRSPRLFSAREKVRATTWEYLKPGLLRFA